MLIRFFNIACVGVLFLFLPQTAASQKVSSSGLSLPEKIYIQFDGNVYTTDQTIWFKAIVTDIDQHPTQLSGVLHVDLIGPDGQLAQSQLVKLENGIGAGAIALIENDATGRYLVRAYTEWNRNFGPEYQFLEYITVFPATQRNHNEAISNIRVIEKAQGKSWVQAQLNPLVVDSLHEGTLTVRLIVDQKVDSLTIRKNNTGSYALEYSLPAGARLGTISFTAKNSERSTKTFAIDERDIDLQFFPEGGELVHGLNSKVAFKALDYGGRGKQVEGDIFNDQGKLIVSFKSNERGMGSFFLKGDTASEYYARIKSGRPDPVKSYRLPDASPAGSVFMIRKVNQAFRVTVASNDQRTDSVYLRVMCRNTMYSFIRTRLKNGGLIIHVPAANLPEGVIAFTLLDRNKQPRAERLVFNENPKGRLLIELQAGETSHQREKTTMNVRVTGSTGVRAPADVSVLVMNKEQLGAIQMKRENILSRFLMSSELRGEIDDPGYYFREEGKNRLDDLDALLLTQGWSRYLYSTLPGTIQFQPEYNLQVSGSVGGLLFKDNKKAGIELTMMTFGQNKMIATQATDSLGQFHFDVDDAYGDKLNFIIQSKNARDQNKDYTIAVDKKRSPEILYTQGVVYADVIDSILVEKNQERKASEEAFRIAGVHYLDEVNVKALRFIPEREKMTEEYGKADVVIDGKDIQEKEQKWSYGLYSIIMNSYPGLLSIRRIGGPSGFLYASVIKSNLAGGGKSPTLVVIDGIPVSLPEYSKIPDIPPGEVKSFEVITTAKNFYQIFRQAFPERDPIDTPVSGGIIAIYTLSGKGLAGIKSTVGIEQMSIPAFTPPREFYAPQYEKLLPDDWNKPDLRSLIHWQPQVKTADDGTAEISFYNSDPTGEVLIVVEAISPEGEIGYQELVYRVMKR